MRSFDPEVFRKAVEPYPDVFKGQDFDFEAWLEDLNNVMYDDDGSVGLCSFEYPGVYTLHWFYKVRGRKALVLAKTMIDDLFTNHGAKTLRGLTEVGLPAAKWAARQIGFKSYGIDTCPKGDYEIFIMTKDDFYKGVE